MVEFWLWGDLGLEDLNLNCKLERDNAMSRLSDCDRS